MRAEQAHVNQINTNNRVQHRLRDRVPREYLKVAQGMETQFANHLIEQMEKSIDRHKQPSSAENYYRSLLNYERAKMIAESDNGLGLQDVILEQIAPASARNKNNYKNVQMYQQQDVVDKE